MFSEQEHRRGFLGKIIGVGASMPILTTLKLPTDKEIKEFGSPIVDLQEVKKEKTIRFYDIICGDCEEILSNISNYQYHIDTSGSNKDMMILRRNNPDVGRCFSTKILEQ